MTSDFLARPDLRGSFGMCASTHWIASAAGQSVLERGGNAFDAAVAAGFVLHVVEPHLNGPGGDMVALIAPLGEPARTLVGQGPAPAAATIDHYRSEGLDMVPGAGALAASVPGAVDALLLLLRDYGTWEVSDVLEYAVWYAERGHPVLAKESATIATVASLFRDHWSTSAALWLPNDRVPRAGDTHRNPAYAQTLRRLSAAAVGEHRSARIDSVRSVWREGFIADAIDAFVRRFPHIHSSGTEHRGVITGDDLACFHATYEDPVVGTFRDVEILKAGAWTQGPVLLQAMGILDGFTDEELDLNTARGVHLVLEALKLSFADREAYYGDQIAPGVLDALVSADYATTRRRLIEETASAGFRPGVPVAEVSPFEPQLVMASTFDRSEFQGTGEPTVNSLGVTNGDTCHLDVVDRWGNMVSATPSGGWLQSSPTVPGLGFALGTRLQMTWLDATSPSALVPRRRPRTTLTPTLLRRGEHVISALGSPGGDQQDQWQAVYIVRLLIGRMSPQEAIEAPAFHTTSFPASFWPRAWTPAGAVIEDRVGSTIIQDLEQRGHVVELAGDWTLGRLSSVTRDPSTGMVAAAANPRGAQGYAVGR